MYLSHENLLSLHGITTAVVHRDVADGGVYHWVWGQDRAGQSAACSTGHNKIQIKYNISPNMCFVILRSYFPPIR